MSKSDRSGETALPSRRTALSVSLAALGVACGSSKSSRSPASEINDVQIADTQSLEVGDEVEFEYPPGHEAFAVRLASPANGGVGPDKTIVAFHRSCPHQGCRLREVSAERGELGPCGCHYSLFDLKRGGAQISGLASQNLVQIELEDRSGTLFATGLQGLPYGEPLTEEQA